MLPAEEPVLARQEIGRGLAFGDLDNDGDPDILMTNNRGPARVLFNQARRSAGGGPHWLAIRLVGDPKQRTNRWGLGARVGLERKGQPTLWRHVQSDGSYLSASDPRVTFGLGAATRVDRLVIEWPNGFVQSVLNPLVDRQLTVRQPVLASPSPK
ncbi:MAG: CRTAC1 family protein [Blastocatellia bacterium]